MKEEKAWYTFSLLGDALFLAIVSPLVFTRICSISDGSGLCITNAFIRGETAESVTGARGGFRVRATPASGPEPSKANAGSCSANNLSGNELTRRRMREMMAGLRPSRGVMRWFEELRNQHGLIDASQTCSTAAIHGERGLLLLLLEEISEQLTRRESSSSRAAG